MQGGVRDQLLGTVHSKDVATVLVKCLDRQPACVLSFFMQAGSPLVSSIQGFADLIHAEDLAGHIIAEQLADLKENRIDVV